MLKLKKMLASTIALAVLMMANAFCVNADSEIKIAEIHDATSMKVAQQIQQNQIPKAQDVLATLKKAGTPFAAVGNVSDAGVDFIEKNIAFNAVALISNPKVAPNGENDEIAVSLYQFAKDGQLVNLDDIRRELEERPTSDSYSNGLSEYQVYGTITVNFAHKPDNDQKWTITSVTVMSNWGTSANKTTRIDYGARVSVGQGTVINSYKRERVSNPGQGQRYTVYTGFAAEGAYMDRTNIMSNLDAGADFYLSNGKIFTLIISFQDNQMMPYGHELRVDMPYVYWD